MTNRSWLAACKAFLNRLKLVCCQAQVNHKKQLALCDVSEGAMGSAARSWWLDGGDSAAVSMVTCWGSFADGLHHSNPGVRLCVPPWGPPYLHRAAQVCSYDGNLLLTFFLDETLINKATVCALCLACHILVTCTASTVFWIVSVLLCVV